MASNLGPMPEPEITPKEPNPGGVDAIDTGELPPTVNELDPEANPAVEESAPDEIKELEDTQTEATSDGDGDGEGSDEDPG